MFERVEDGSGTSFHGDVVEATPNEIAEVLGEPRFCNNDGRDKVNISWSARAGGDVFTVYDWKEGRPLYADEVVSWHIGGFTPEATARAKRRLVAALGS
jgi:hypothetical protein